MGVFSWLFRVYCGVDEFGNKYYESNKKDYLGRRRRYVIYNGLAEASKVPAEWHGWLHYYSDDVGCIDHVNKKSWWKDHLPNLTGTKYRYDPRGGKGARTKTYSAWTPARND